MHLSSGTALRCVLNVPVKRARSAARNGDKVTRDAGRPIAEPLQARGAGSPTHEDESATECRTADRGERVLPAPVVDVPDHVADGAGDPDGGAGAPLAFDRRGDGANRS